MQGILGPLTESRKHTVAVRTIYRAAIPVLEQMREKLSILQPIVIANEYNFGVQATDGSYLMAVDIRFLKDTIFVVVSYESVRKTIEATVDKILSMDTNRLSGVMEKQLEMAYMLSQVKRSA